MVLNIVRNRVTALLVAAGLALGGCSGGRESSQPPPDGSDAPNASETRGGDADASEPPGVPIDLARFARLSATDPVPQPPFPWPREAEDAVATVRDDWAASSYKARAGNTRIEIDLLPWLGGPVPLTELGLSFDSLGPDAASVTLLPFCPPHPWVPGEDPVGSSALPASSQPLAWPDPTLPLPLPEAAAGCVVVDFESQQPFVITQLRLASSAPGVEAPSGPTAPAPKPAQHLRSGVVEGFYGVPWSWRERTNMVAHLSLLGLGVYIHAPKNDPRHRQEWRTPYEADEMQHFAELAVLGRARGVKVFAGMSPFVDWGPDFEADYDVLLTKLRAFQEAGIRGFVLLADDIEFDIEQEVDGAMGEAHIDIANRLLKDLEATAQASSNERPDRSGDPAGTDEVEVWFVPTVYSDERADDWAGGLEYLASLAALDPSIRIMWTGPGTSNATLTASDFDRVAEFTGRKPVLWENYWANDGGDGFVGRLPLAPFAGRDPSVTAAVDGIVANPLIQGALSRLPVSSLARYLDDPGDYGPSGQQSLSADSELPFLVSTSLAAFDSAAYLERMQCFFEADTLGEPGWQEMVQAISALDAALDKPDSLPIEEAAILLDLFGRGLTQADLMRRAGIDPDMDDELVYPLRKVSLDSRVGLYALLSLADRLSGGDPASHSGLAKAARSDSLVCRFVFSDDRVGDLLAAVLAQPTVDRGLEPVLPAEPFPACADGVTLTWTPFESCNAPNVFGLPGATVDGPVVSWMPPLPGAYSVVAVCAQGSGWGAVITSADCPDPMD